MCVWGGGGGHKLCEGCVVEYNLSVWEVKGWQYAVCVYVGKIPRCMT